MDLCTCFYRCMGDTQVTNSSWKGVRNRAVWGECAFVALLDAVKVTFLIVHFLVT